MSNIIFRFQHSVYILRNGSDKIYSDLSRNANREYTQPCSYTMIRVVLIVIIIANCSTIDYFRLYFSAMDVPRQLLSIILYICHVY